MNKSLLNVRTVSDALTVQTHSLAAIRRTCGHDKVESLIKLHLVNLNDLLGLKRPLNEYQIDEIATEVVSTHFHLTMADVHVIMRRAKTGHYGEFFESLTMPKVMGWFASYFEERCDTAVNRSLDAHSQVKEYNDINRATGDRQERKEFEKAKALHLIHKSKKSK